MITLKENSQNRFFLLLFRTQILFTVWVKLRSFLRLHFRTPLFNVPLQIKQIMGKEHIKTIAHRKQMPSVNL